MPLVVITKMRKLFGFLRGKSTKITHISDYSLGTLVCCGEIFPGMEPLIIQNNEQNQQFQLYLNDERAFLEYRLKDDAIVLMHTEVPEKLGGKGIASALAAHAFNYAREKHLRVKVYCPFVATWVKKHPEQLDIVIPPKEQL